MNLILYDNIISNLNIIIQTMFRVLGYFLLIIALISPISSFADNDVMNLTLEQAKTLALEKNRDIQIQQKNVEIAGGEITKQEGAFDPLLFLSGSYTDSQTPTVSTFIESGSIEQKISGLESGISGDLSTGTYYNLFNISLTRTETNSPIESLSPNLFADLSFTVGQELLRNFGRDVNLTFVRNAKKDEKISSSNLERTVSDVLFGVESDYWLLVAAKQNLELEQEALKLALDLQNRNEIQVDVGVLPPVAVTQAQAEVAARKVDVITAENRLQRAEDRLKNRLVIPLETKIKPVDEPKNYETKIDEDEALQQAYKNRPEIQNVRLNIEKSEQLKHYYSNQRLPSLSLEGSVELQGIGGDANPDRLTFNNPPAPIPGQFNSQSDAINSVFGGDFPTWSILATLQFPLFNREAKGEYVKANAQLSRDIIDMNRIKDQVALEVRNAIREVINSKRAVDAALVSIKLRQEVVDNETEKLSVGLATTRDVLEAQRDLIDSQTSKINAITEFNIALVQLENVKGTILQSNNIVIQDDNINYKNTYTPETN